VAFSSRAVPLALALATFLAFLPVLSNDFVAWDDRRNLYDNPAYRGLGWPQLRWMFTNYTLGHYIPLTWLSFGLDYAVWGMNPFGYHLTNLLLHIAGAVLFFFVSRRLLQRATAFSPAAVGIGAAVAALFFAIHPLRVESVAWATERRDVLSGALFFLTILTYLKAADAGGSRRRWLLTASVGTFLLALASKSIVMMLPLVLILLDAYPLRRLHGGPREWFGQSQRWVWLEKAPYLLLGAAGAVVSYYAHAYGAAPHDSPWLSRAVTALYGLWFYIFKTAIPVGLSPLYEAPVHIHPLEGRFLVSAVGMVGASLVALLLRVRWPAGLALWIYYGIFVAPVSGIVHIGGFYLTADRYSYLSCLGWAVLVGAGAGAVVDGSARGTLRSSLARLVAGAAAVWFLGLGILTWRQAQVWRDTESLWQHAVTVTPDCALCHKFLGESLVYRGALLAGLEHLEHALALRPDRVEFRIGVGVAFTHLGMWQEALDQYRRVLERHPGQIEARNDLAMALVHMGRLTEAVEHLYEALRRAPNNPTAHVTLGFAFKDMGKADEAAEHFRRAIELKPDSAAARLGLVQAYVALGKKDLAREQYDALRGLDPQLATNVESAFTP